MAQHNPPLTGWVEPASLLAQAVPRWPPTCRQTHSPQAARAFGHPSARPVGAETKARRSLTRKPLRPGGFPSANTSSKPLDQQAWNTSGSGIAAGVDVRQRCAGVGVAEQGHVDRPDRRAEGVLLGDRGALDRPGPAPGHRWPASRAAAPRRARSAAADSAPAISWVNGGERSARTCATRRWISVIAAPDRPHHRNIEALRGDSVTARPVVVGAQTDRHGQVQLVDTHPVPLVIAPQPRPPGDEGVTERDVHRVRGRPSAAAAATPCVGSADQ